MLIRNASLVNQEMRLRSSGAPVFSDGNGVFEVPEKDGTFLLSTGKPWEAWDGPFVRPDPVIIPEGAVPADVRQAFEEAVHKHRVRAEELEAKLTQRDATIRELEGRLAAALERVQASAIPAPQIGGGPVVDAPIAENEEIDLDSLEKPDLLDLAKQYEVKVDHRWGVDKIRAALSEVMFEKE